MYFTAVKFRQTRCARLCHVQTKMPCGLDFEKKKKITLNCSLSTYFTFAIMLCLLSINNSIFRHFIIKLFLLHLKLILWIFSFLYRRYIMTSEVGVKLNFCSLETVSRNRHPQLQLIRNVMNKHNCNLKKTFCRHIYTEIFQRCKGKYLVPSDVSARHVEYILWEDIHAKRHSRSK